MDLFDQEFCNVVAWFSKPVVFYCFFCAQTCVLLFVAWQLVNLAAYLCAQAINDLIQGLRAGGVHVDEELVLRLVCARRTGLDVGEVDALFLWGKRKAGRQTVDYCILESQGLLLQTCNNAHGAPPEGDIPSKYCGLSCISVQLSGQGWRWNQTLWTFTTTTIQKQIHKHHSSSSSSIVFKFAWQLQNPKNPKHLAKKK